MTGKERRKKMSRRMFPVLVILMLMLMVSAAVFLGGCGQKNEEVASGDVTTDAEAITSLEQLKKPGVKIGVSSDTPEDKVVQKEFPEAEIVYTQDNMFAYTPCNASCRRDDVYR